MKYFKNTELAKLYHVSEKSVRNWIESARTGKLDLQLFEAKDKSYVANTASNARLIEELVQNGKKYKNKRGFREVSPTKKFYEMYDQKQILDIISSLTIHHEIPLQYTYVNGGADYWDQYAKRLISEQTPNLLVRTLELLDVSSDNIDRLVSGRSKVNVVDLGPGNGLPIRPTLARLLEQGKLKRYIAIDVSKEMLHILEQNVRTWFGDKVKFEGHVRDFGYERFDDLLADDNTGNDDDVPANLVFSLGGTLNNFRYPDRVLQAINSRLGLSDLLIHAGYLDTPHTRRYFDFDVSSLNQKLAPMDHLILDFLNIDETLYDVQQLFDEEKRARSISILPKVDLSIKFELANGTRSVELRKNEPILLWRHWHKDAVEIINQFDQNSFDIMQATKSPDNQYLILISRIKTDS